MKIVQIDFMFFFAVKAKFIVSNHKHGSHVDVMWLCEQTFSFEE